MRASPTSTASNPARKEAAAASGVARPDSRIRTASGKASRKGAAVGAPLAGLIFDLTQSYRGAFLIGGLAMVVATLLISLLFRFRRSLKTGATG